MFQHQQQQPRVDSFMTRFKFEDSDVVDEIEQEPEDFANDMSEEEEVEGFMNDVSEQEEFVNDVSQSQIVEEEEEEFVDDPSEWILDNRLDEEIISENMETRMVFADQQQQLNQTSGRPARMRVNINNVRIVPEIAEEDDVTEFVDQDMYESFQTRTYYAPPTKKHHVPSAYLNIKMNIPLPHFNAAMNFMLNASKEK